MALRRDWNAVCLRSIAFRSRRNLLMTPEERAKQMTQKLMERGCISSLLYIEWIEQSIATEIRLAIQKSSKNDHQKQELKVAKERERCAKIAEQMDTCSRKEPCCGKEIATAIREKKSMNHRREASYAS